MPYIVVCIQDATVTSKDMNAGGGIWHKQQTGKKLVVKNAMKKGKKKKKSGGITQSDCVANLD